MTGIILGHVGIQQVIKVCWEKRVFPPQGAPEHLWVAMCVTGRNGEYTYLVGPVP